MTPIQQKNKTYTPRNGSFRRTNNFPLDYDFIISSLENLDEELPVVTRYNGQIFFSVLEGKLYHFVNESEDNEIIEDYVCLDEETVYSLVLETEDYTNIITELDELFGDIEDKTGRRCYIKPLNIMAVNDGDSWVYGGGDYRISALSVWDTIPVTLMSVGRQVRVGGLEYYNVGEDFVLEKRYIKAEAFPETLREGVYYEIGDYLYRVTGGYPWKIAVKRERQDPVVSEESYVTITNIDISNEFINHLSSAKNNIINHQLDSYNLNVVLLVGGDQRIGYSCSPEFELIDRDNISIKSMSYIRNCKIIVTKICEDEEPDESEEEQSGE